MSDQYRDINIMIIEDEALVAMDIESRLIKMGFGIAGVYGDSDKALAFLEIHHPDLILCDINISGPKDGIDIAMHVHHHKHIPLIFVTALSDRSTLERAKKALPYGYIVKPFEDTDLESALEMALYKHQVELDKLTITEETIDSLVMEPLSKREFELLKDIISGMSNQQISDARYISMNTTKFHVSNIFKKMNVNSRAQVLQKILSLYT